MHSVGRLPFGCRRRVNKKKHGAFRLRAFLKSRIVYFNASIASLMSAMQVALSVQTFVVNVNVSTMVSMLAVSSAWDDGGA